MRIGHIAKTALVLMTLLSFIACSSTSEEAEPSSPAVSSETDADAANRRAEELAEEARRRAAEAEERLVRAALSTTVFYFDFDVAEFRSADRDVLTYHAQDLAGNQNKRIRLEGHADERGTREYNIALGERRAEAIQNYLIVNGAARAQIETVSYGEEQPANRGSNENAYQLNRRVEIITE
ncbi:MAG: peptidoglycan-associated lipoprotein Pal [Gammaproteobacteria bacterium]|jgi:peptidoglycan-associated lipoprotein|nr:peptidoglycan-associated lipoprotein [Gammaproteobacteria bacterium]MDP6094453.1 peptidoglycan-associated lipoprotein Pal [Gammaproteobacteria bacterium]HJO12165.1 peptidoglycan-associated lipoprotein Pal [Gammaproteobacteria bacterium]|tara:strand:- start:14515 stop:15057 length:543 start_codon:yes stop_codon:yes gene_type:complete